MVHFIHRCGGERTCWFQMSGTVLCLPKCKCLGRAERTRGLASLKRHHSRGEEHAAERKGEGHLVKSARLSCGELRKCERLLCVLRNPSGPRTIAKEVNNECAVRYQLVGPIHAAPQSQEPDQERGYAKTRAALRAHVHRNVHV